MSIKAGDLRQVAILLRPVATTNEKGRRITEWQEAATVPVAFADVSGREFFQALAYQAEDIVTITLRWREDVTPEWRVRRHGTDYDILEVNHLGYMQDYMRLKCRMVAGEAKT